MERSNVPFLEMEGITKRFPGVLALDDVSLTVYPGEVLALVGENGAGKSTLMKILSGVYTKDAGSILIEGRGIDITGPLHARQLGISIIYQELNVLNNMDIAENIFVGREKRKNGFVDKKLQHEEARILLDRVGLSVDTHTRTGKLSTAQKQMVEVAKALSMNAKMIIMDEPTSSLTDKETEMLFGIIQKLRSDGVAIVFISHRMNEIFQIADRIAVMRDGRMIQTIEAADATEEKIIAAMVGRDVNNLFAKLPSDVGGAALEVRGPQRTF